MTGENNESSPAEPYTRRIRPNESTTVAVVRAVAESQDTSSVDLDPLAESIDADALEAVLASGENVDVTFDYAGTRVVAGERRVTVRTTEE